MHAEVEVVVTDRSNAALLDSVAVDVFDYPVRADCLESFLSDPRSILVVAVAGGMVVGMVTGILYTHPDKPLQLFVNEIGVAENYRRNGIAKRLLARMLDEASARGCTEAWVATEVGNAAARALYAGAHGQEDPDRAVVYTWRLGSGGADQGR